MRQARRSRQRKLQRSCSEAERKQGEGFHGSLKKTVFQYGLRGGESGQ